MEQATEAKPTSLLIRESQFPFYLHNRNGGIVIRYFWPDMLLSEVRELESTLLKDKNFCFGVEVIRGEDEDKKNHSRNLTENTIWEVCNLFNTSFIENIATENSREGKKQNRITIS